MKGEYPSKWETDKYFTRPKTTQTYNCTQQNNIDEWEMLSKKWKLEKKLARVEASFNNILELEEKHLKHFKNAPYIWKPMQGKIYAGMLMDNSMNYIKLVLVSEEVLEYIFKL